MGKTSFAYCRIKWVRKEFINLLAYQFINLLVTSGGYNSPVVSPFFAEDNMRKLLVVFALGMLLSASPSQAMLMENGDGGDGGGGGGGGGGGTTTTTTTTTTTSSACTSSTAYCPGASCSNLGQTQMSADKVDIMACMEPTAGNTNYVWKAMTTVSTVSSLTSNGYQELPSGLIIQWGKTSGSGSTETANFLKQFPHACLQGVGNVSVPRVTSREINVQSCTQYSITLQIQNADGDNVSDPVSWIAVGY